MVVLACVEWLGVDNGPIRLENFETGWLIKFESAYQS